MKPTYTPRLSFYSIFAVVLLLFACHDEPPTVVEQPQELSVQEELATDSLTPTVLGKKLENPYSVTNMRKAFTSLQLMGYLCSSSLKMVLRVKTLRKKR